MDRGVGEHDTQLGVVRRHLRGGKRTRSSLPFQQNDRLLMARQHLLLVFEDLTFPPYRFQILHHQGEGFHGSFFSLPQGPDCLPVGPVTAEMKPADPLDPHDLSVPDRRPDCPDRLRATLVPAQQIHFRSALIAADRLGIIPSGFRMGILILAFRTHGKIRHAGPHPVIRHPVKDGQSGSAAGAVDKGMQIPPVLRIVHFLPAAGADRNVR